jgi:transposase
MFATGADCVKTLSCDRFRSVLGDRPWRFVEGEDRRQSLLLPESLDDYVTEDNPVRVVEVFIDELDLGALGFAGVQPAATARPAYHPATLLKIYLYGYLNRVQSSRRLEREAQRNIELLWLTGRLAPDFKTIANFRRDNGPVLPCVPKTVWTSERGLTSLRSPRMPVSLRTRYLPHHGVERGPRWTLA